MVNKVTSPSTTSTPFCTFYPSKAETVQPPAPEKQEPDFSKSSWLTQDEKEPLSSTFDFKLFCLESCDPFIGKTSLEGTTSKKAMDRFFDCLKRSDRGNQSISSIPLLEKAAEWVEEIDVIMSAPNDAMPRMLQEASQKMLDQISNLKVGEKVVLPGGWSGTGGKGHALFHLVTKTSKDTYSFITSTTGGGLEFHEGASIDGAIRAESYHRIESIKQEDMCRIEFFQGLLGLQILPVMNNMLTLGEENLYTGLLAALKGKYKKNPLVRKNPWLMRKPQHSGTCGMEAIFGLIRAEMIENAKGIAKKRLALHEYRQIKFSYRKRSLLDACKHFFDESVVWSKTEHDLIEAATEYLGRLALKLKKQGLISEEEFGMYALTSIDIKNRLAEKKANYRPTKLSPLNLKVNLQKKSKVPLFLSSFENVAPSNTAKSTEIRTISTTPTPKKTVFIPTEMGQTLAKWVDELTEFANTPYVNPSQICESLSRFLYTLPLPNTDEGKQIWDNVPEEQINMCLQHLFQLSGLYFSIKEKNLPTPQVVIGSHIATVIGEHLARRQAANKLKNMSLDYTDLIKFSHSHQTTILNPADQQKLQEVLGVIFDGNVPNHISDKHLKSMKEDSIFLLHQDVTIEKTDYRLPLNLLFYQLFLNDAAPELAKRNLTILTKEDQLGAIMGEKVDGKGVLPKGVLYLRQLAFFSAGILREADASRPFKEWHYRVETSAGRVTKNVSLTLQVDKNALHLNGSHYSGKHEYLFFKKNNAENKIYAHFDFARQNQLMHRVLKEERRDMGITGCERADELVRALAYYQERPEALFEDPTEQYIFFQHLLRPGKLHNQLISEPAMAVKLLSFVNQRLAFFQSCEKKDPMLYFCQLGHFCKRYVAYAQAQNPTEFKKFEKDLEAVLLDYRKMALETVIPLCNTMAERNIVYQQLQGFHLGQESYALTNEDIKTAALDFFLAKIYAPISFMNEIKTSASLEWKSKFEKKFYNVLLPKAKDLMKQDGQVCNDILNGILSAVLQTKCSYHWNGSYPKFFVDGYKINLSTFQISESDKVFSCLPQWVFEDNKDFDRLFDQITEIKLKEDGCYLIKDKHGVTEINLGERIFHAERMINGTTYRYIPNVIFPEKLTKKIGTEVIDEQTIIWMTLQNPNPHYLLQKSESGKKDLYIYLNKTKRYNHRFKLQCVTDDPQKKRVLVNPNETKIISSFELKAHTFCWVDPQEPRQLKEFEYPRFGLHFDVKEGKAWCREVPGFYLSLKRNMEHEWRSCLVLKNENHAKKILFPKVDFRKEATYEHPFDITLDAISADDSTHQALLYDVEEIEGVRRLKASSASDYLFLAAYYYKKKCYEEALYYLRRSRNLEIFSKSDQKILKGMEKDLFDDGHPSGIVVGLKAYLLAEENRLQYDPDHHLSMKGTEKKAAANPRIIQYLQYLQNLNNTTLTQLSLEEEKSLIRIFTSTGSAQIPMLLQRLQFLLNPKAKVKPIYIPRSPEEALPFDKKQATYVYGFADLFKNQEEAENKTFLISMNQEDFKLQYPTFYNWARSGTPEQVKHLKYLLEIIKGNAFYQDALQNKQDVLVYIKILHEVLKKPKKFPTYIEIMDAVTSDDSWYKFYNERILKNLKSSSSIIALLKKAPEYLALFRTFFGFKKMQKKLLHEIPKIPKKAPEAKLIYAAPFLEFDKAQDTFFADLLDKFFTVELKQVDGRAKIEEIKDDPLSEAYVKNVIKDLESFYETRDSTKKVYHVNPFRNILDIKQELVKGLETSKSFLQTKEAEILLFVNKPSNVNPMEDLVKKAAKRLPTLNISQAIALFEKGKGSEYRTLTCLTDAEIKQFETMMTQYLVTSTRNQQIDRVITHLDAYAKLSPDSDEKEILMQKIGEELNATRSYSEKNNNQLPYIRTFLVFEHRNRILLRKKQVDILEKVLSFPAPMKLFLKLGTGTGKSKVLAKLFEWIRRELVEHVINVWPSELYPVNKFDSKKQSEITFDQIADTFDLNRDTSTDIYHLEFVLRELKRSRLENRQLNTRPESVQAAELKFLEILFNATRHGISAFEGKIKTFQEKLKEIFEIEAHFDEGHIALAAKRELNFTVGDPRKEPLENVVFLEEIFRYLVQDKEMLKLINIKKNQQELVSEDTIKQQICPAIAKHMMQFLKIDAKDEKEFLDYILVKKDHEPRWVFNHPQKQLIGLLKGEIALLPDMLYKKAVNVHYGFSKLHPEILYAKPYEASDSPVEHADYDNIHETFTKTYLTYLNNRLTNQKIWDLVRHLQGEALAESKRRLIPIENTKAYQFFKQHFPASMGDLFRIGQEQIQNWSAEINANDEIIFHYVKVFVAPTIKKYPFKFKSNVQNLMAQFRNGLAMSATPGNPTGYGHATKYQPDVGGDEQVLDALDKKCADPKKMHEIDSRSPSEFFDTILTQIFGQKNDFRVLIDIGAMFKGLSNLDMAQRLIKHFASVNPDIKGVVFFHEERLMVLEAGRSELIPFEQCQLAPENRFTLYDHKHKFGLDVKQWAKATALATYAKQTTNDDILQGVGRMRELLQDQKVEWATSKEVLAAIHNQAQKFEFKDLRQLGFKNQAEQEAENLPKSFKQQMHNEIRSVLMQKLIHAKTEREAVKLAKAFFPILLEQIELDPFTLYGGIDEARTDIEDLLLYRDKLLKQLKELSSLKKSEKAAIRKKLLGYSDLIKQKEKYFSQEKKRHLVSTGVEAEIQQHIETRTEINREIQNVNLKELQKLRSFRWSETLDLFKDNWVKITPGHLLKIKQIIKRLINLPVRTAQYALRLRDFLRIQRHSPLYDLLSAQIILVSLPILIPLGGISLVAIIGNIGFNLFGRVVHINLNCQMYSSSTVVGLASDRRTAGLHKFFETKSNTSLLMTNNFIPLAPKRTTNWPIDPLGKEQRLLYEVLVIEEEQSNGEKKLTVIMGDQSTDAAYWRRKLADDAMCTSAEEAAKRKRKVCLYDLNIGIVQNGKNAFNEQELKDNPAFQELIVKAKIYNADVTYSDKEEEALKRLVKEPKVKEKLKKFFENALVWHDSKQIRYQNSPIDIVLNQAVEAA